MTGNRAKEYYEKSLRALYPATGIIASLVGYKLKSPVFIVGTGRCGTTLLVRILQSHPGLLGFPDEANHLWHPLMYPFKSAKIKTKPIEFNPKTFTETSLDNWPPNHQRLVYDTFTGFSMLRGRNRKLFVKSAMISFMIPKILEIFPDSRFIHIFRSGPSVVSSYFKRNTAKYPEVISDENEYRVHCARYWNDCILEIERARVEHKLDQRGAYFELSYESLCKDPESIMKKTAEFMGVKADLFAYDVSQVSSTNYKVGDFSKIPSWERCLKEMAPAMNSKEYKEYL